MLTRDQTAKLGNHRTRCKICGDWMLWRPTQKTPVYRSLRDPRLCVDCYFRDKPSAEPGLAQAR